MKKVFLILCVIISVIVIEFGLACLDFNCNHYWKVTTLAEYESPDGQYTLALEQVGEPFLKKDEKAVDEEEIYRGFGRWSDFGSVAWNDDSVSVCIVDTELATLRCDSP